jgi:predicted nucleic acid-binding protein
MLGGLMYLLDSNIFLELLLDQDKADEVERLLRTVPREKLHISEFLLYSAGIVLFRRHLYETFVRFVDDLVVTGGARLLRISVQDMEALAVVARQFSLDFDDAYHYVLAEKYGLEIISFDSDFDRTRKGRKIPAQIEGDFQRGS